jgi:Sulfotransferase family
MINDRRFVPNTLVARLDVNLQSLSDQAGIRKEYYDFREAMRARVEKIDLVRNHAQNAIFIHIPKCGGTSVENQIEVFHGHRSAVYFRTLDRAFFDRAFTFALVRNPYDRLVSGFHYLKHHTTSPLNHDWVARNIRRFADFQAFAEALEEPSFARRITGWKHFVPQWYFVCDRAGDVLVDHIGKLEAFDNFVAAVEVRSAIRLRNEVHRASARKPWQEYYSDHTRGIVAKLYAQDFRLFDYAP